MVPDQDSNIVQMPDRLARLATRIRAALDKAKFSDAIRLDATIELCVATAEARDLYPSDQAFGEWWDAQGFKLNKNDRAAAVQMGRDPGRLREILGASGKWSLQNIHEKEWRFPTHRKPAGEQLPVRRQPEHRRLEAPRPEKPTESSPMESPTVEQPTESISVPETKTTGPIDPRVRKSLHQSRGRGLEREKLAQACAIVRPLLALGKPLGPYQLAKEHGLSMTTFDNAINREVGRLEGRAEFIAEGMVSLKIVRQRFLPLLKRVKRQSKVHVVNLSQPELRLIVSDGLRALQEWAEGSENAVRPGFSAVLQSRPEDDGDLEDE